MPDRSKRTWKNWWKRRRPRNDMEWNAWRTTPLVAVQELQIVAESSTSFSRQTGLGVNENL